MFYHILSLGWNGSDCVSGQEAAPRIRDKSTPVPWSRHLQQRRRGLFSVSQHVLEEDELETDSCKSNSPSVSFQLPSSIVGAVQQNLKSTSYRATSTSCKVRSKFVNSFTQSLKKSIWLAICYSFFFAV